MVPIAHALAVACQYTAPWCPLRPCPRLPVSRRASHMLLLLQTRADLFRPSFGPERSGQGFANASHAPRSSALSLSGGCD